MFSKPAKEITKNPDKEIYEELEKIKFRFGDKEPTVGVGGLVFVYEVGLDLFQVYVVAFTENYGTIVFYLPEELTEKIADRVAQLPTSFDNYLFRLIDYKPETFAFSYALAQCGCSVEEAANSLMTLSNAMKMETSKPIDIRIRSNNWLKLHGYPMRRKKGKRKHE
ncbi:MAG: hypothetical protein PHP32_00705 [Candidatus Izemoplasmatales bacterium]|nr:hypothetical protein [Candidatus Izemoplasmatales bacterium]